MLWLLAFACTGTPAPESVAEETCVSIPSPSHRPVAHHIEQPLVFDAATVAAAKTLNDALLDHALQPDLPWAIGHALVALGPDLKLSNGSDAVDWMFSTYGERIQLADHDHGLVFPENRGSTRVEPHPSLILKAITDAGVDSSRAIRVDGHNHTIADLYRGTLATHWHNTATGSTSFPSLNDMPWSLMALVSWSEPKTRWRSMSPGSTNCMESSLSAFAQQVGAGLETSTDFLAKAQSSGASFQKRRQGIFKYTCGGAHLIQGVLHADLRGFGEPSTSSRVGRQLELLRYRFPIELNQIDAAIESNPKYRIPLAVQRLKLTGHTLETVARVAAAGTTIDIPQTELRLLVKEVTTSVDLLRGLKVYQNLHIAQSENEQFFLDVVGDSAHALRGLSIASGQRPVYY